MTLREPQDDVSRRGRSRGFYAWGMPSPDEARADASEEQMEGLIMAIRARVAAIMSGRPEDVRLLLKSAEALLKAEVADRRLRPPVRRDLAENVQRVLDLLGSQLLPPDG